MNDETAREKLEAALEDAGVVVWLERTLLADALLPVVREIVAEELRPIREIVERHAWGEEDPLAVRDELERALHPAEAAS